MCKDSETCDYYEVYFPREIKARKSKVWECESAWQVSLVLAQMQGSGHDSRGEVGQTLGSLQYHLSHVLPQDRDPRAVGRSPSSSYPASSDPHLVPMLPAILSLLFQQWSQGSGNPPGTTVLHSHKSPAHSLPSPLLCLVLFTLWQASQVSLLWEKKVK